MRIAEPDTTFLAERRRQVVRALQQTRAEIGNSSVDKTADKALQEVERRLTGPPDPGIPGVVTVRVVGVPGKNEPATPLAGISLHLKVGDQVVAETQTDDLGLGQLELPKNGYESYEIEAIGPGCQVIACQRSLVASDSTELNSPIHLFNVAKTEGLTPNFERAKPWQDALVSARKRRDLSVQAAKVALQRQESELVKLIEEIDQVLTCKSSSQKGG